MGLLCTLGTTSCTPEDYTNMHRDTPEYLFEYDSELPDGSEQVATVAGEGFKLEVRQDPATADEVMLMFYTDGAFLNTVGHKLQIVLGTRLTDVAEVNMTVKDKWGDLTGVLEVVEGTQDNSVFFSKLIKSCFAQ